MAFDRIRELTGAPQQITEGSWNLSDYLEKYCDENRLHSFEGPSGMKKFQKITSVLGYKDFDAFMEDNPGAFEALITFIGQSRVPEWIEAFKAEGIDEESETD
jgi:hypothetical protein